MDYKVNLKLYLIYALVALTFADNTGNESDVHNEDNLKFKEVVLSRRKRFITFPDGSSFQLVFCTQNHGFLQIGDVVWFGNTAALAWELPSDPTLFNMLKKYEKPYDALRRHDSKHIIFLNEDGKVISTKPYKRRPIVNPAFAKRSVDTQVQADTKKTFSIKDMHESHANSSFFTNLDEQSIEFHREGRKSLYAKLETFFEALGWRGKKCLQRLICETGKAKNSQGSFLEEVVRATFTLPRSNKSQLHPDYDINHKNADCALLYPECDVTNPTEEA